MSRDTVSYIRQTTRVLLVLFNDIQLTQSSLFRVLFAPSKQQQVRDGTHQEGRATDDE